MASTISVWPNTTCDLPADPTRFKLGSDICGFALLPVNGGFGVVASVFADPAREMVTDEEGQRVILGHLIAHELDSRPNQRDHRT